MKLNETSIYPFIKDSPSLCKIYNYSRGEKIVNADGHDGYVWYLISGVVKVETTNPAGKVFLVDTIPADNYVGNLSNLRNKNFYCDSYAVISSKLIRIPIETFMEMLQNAYFSNHYYSKVSDRLYDMYKWDMCFHMFPQQEWFAFFILEHTRNNICTIASNQLACQQLRISKRNFYNLINKFEDDGYLERSHSGSIYIKNTSLLQEKAQQVSNFFYNRF